MRSMQWQLGMVGTISEFAIDKGKPRKHVSNWPVAGNSGY
jgi:hypothetical protein